MASQETDFYTKCTHIGGHSNAMKSHVTPIFQTASFVFDSPEHGADLFAGRQEGYIYTRLGNPTVAATEEAIAELEGGVGAVAFGAGMGASCASLFPFLQAGDSAIVGDTLYGCTVDLVQDWLPKYGIETITVDGGNLEEVEKAFKPNTKVVYIETPGNPTNKLCDIPEIAKMTHERGAILVVDNTFCSPYFQKPLKLGADIVVASCTKYLNGHSDSISGILVASKPEQLTVIREWRKVSGSLMSPFDAFLVARGLKTLPLRMDRIQSTALKVAEWLEQQPCVERVNHPGLKSFPQYELGKKLMTGYSGTFSFEMKGGYDAAKTLLKNVKLMTVCVSLGAPDTLIQHPASMTHACVPEHLMRKQGLTPGMIRISIGLEDPKDLIADFEQAMAAIKSE